MSEPVERNCHAAVGGHAAEWALHEDGKWEATYGPYKEDGQEEHLEAARTAAKSWVATLHKVHTGSALPEE